MRVAACQMTSMADKDETVGVALGLLDKAAGFGADIAVLPEYTDFQADLDLSHLGRIRGELPALTNRRPDIYSLGEAA